MLTLKNSDEEYDSTLNSGRLATTTTLRWHPGDMNRIQFKTAEANCKEQYSSGSLIRPRGNKTT